VAPEQVSTSPAPTGNFQYAVKCKEEKGKDAIGYDGLVLLALQWHASLLVRMVIFKSDAATVLDVFLISTRFTSCHGECHGSKYSTMLCSSRSTH
jgi:hypothetical protein